MKLFIIITLIVITISVVLIAHYIEHVYKIRLRDFYNSLIENKTKLAIKLEDNTIDYRTIKEKGYVSDSNYTVIWYTYEKLTIDNKRRMYTDYITLDYFTKNPRCYVV